MPEQSRVAVCRRCGIGFLITPHYREHVVRWGARVSVPQLCARCFHRRGPLPKLRGAVNWFSPRKHYGFITGERGRQIFLHQNAVWGDSGRVPHEGQPALYHVRYAVKGPEALNVELMETASSTRRQEER